MYNEPQPFNSPLSMTTQMSWYQNKHLPIHSLSLCSMSLTDFSYSLQHPPFSEVKSIN